MDSNHHELLTYITHESQQKRLIKVTTAKEIRTTCHVKIDAHLQPSYVFIGRDPTPHDSLTMRWLWQPRWPGELDPHLCRSNI